MPRPASPPPHDPSDVADAVHSAAIHLLRRVRKEDEQAGLSPAKLSALSVLVFGGPMRLTGLAAAEQVRPPSMTRLVTAMERDGLVRRRGDPDDARAVRLEATAKGARVLKEGRRRRVSRLARALRGCSADELRLLARAAVLIEALATGPDAR
jgi:DNA-binding MarR family transcriptional regulator